MEPKFVYDLPKGWENEMVKLPNGDEVPRYGRLRQREFMHLGDEAPFYEDGSLFDLCNMLRVIRPVNIIKKSGVVVHPATCRVDPWVQIVVLDLAPGAGVYGDVGN